MEKVKKIKIMRLIGILSIIGSIMLFAGEFNQQLKDPERDPSGVIIIVVLVILVVGIILVSIAKKKGRSICMKCGTSLFGCEYRYYELGTTQDNRGNETTTVEFSATCPECGAEKTFTRKYTSYISAKFDNAGVQTAQARQINIEPQVKKTAKKYFGH